MLLAVFSCKKPDVTITYPPTYDNKLNLLRDTDFVLQPGSIYSAAAYLPEGTSIHVVWKPTTGKDWAGTGFYTPDRIGYKYYDFYPDSLIFDATGEDDYVNVALSLGSGPNSLDIIIYENDSPGITRQKTVKNFRN